MTLKKYLIGYYRLSRIDVILKDFYFPLIIVAVIAAENYSFEIILGCLVSLAILAYAFVVNDCEDYQDDVKDPKKALRNPISAKFLTYSQAVWLLRLTAILSVLVSLLSGSLVPIAIALSGLLAGHLYSWKVIRFKSIPVLDILSHVYALAMVEVLYFLSLPGSEVSLGSYLIFIGVGFFSGGGCFYNQYRDYEVDRKTNITNTAHFLPKEAVKYLSIASYVIGVGLCAAGIVQKVFGF